MPELLSLKDRLKLFEKEIEQQGAAGPPAEAKKDRKFSFLSEDELRRMKEEEAARIASLNKMDLELFDSLTSNLSHDADTDAVLEQVPVPTPHSVCNITVEMFSEFINIHDRVSSYLCV
jgi:hypothetical protein